LNGSYTNAAKTAGIKFRLQGQAKTHKDNSPVISLPIAFGWATFFNIVTLNAGIIDDGTWNSGGAMLDGDMGEGLGMSLKVSPFTGLDFGFGVYAISSLGGGDNNILASAIDKNHINMYQTKYTINAGYTLPNAFKFTATFRPNNDAGGDKDQDESMKSIIGFRLLAVKNLTAIAEAELDNLHEFDSNGKVSIYETIGYSFDALSFGLNAGEYLTRKKNSDLGIRLNPWVSYAFGGVKLRLDVVYFIGGKIDGTDKEWEGKYHRKGYAATNNADDTVITIRPSIIFAIDSKTVLEIGDAVNIETWHENYYGADGHKKNNRLTNVFYIDMKWSF
jgi:hypothetical protein